MKKMYYSSIKQQTDNKFLNMYEMDAINRKGEHFPYYFASRRDKAHLACVTQTTEADGVVIYALLKEDPEKIVLVKQYRFPLGQELYELPAGLIDEGEDAGKAAVREMKEETGYSFEVYDGGESCFRRSFVQAQGLCDECDRLVFGYAGGIPSVAGNESTEYIEVCVADKKEARRILREENVTVRLAYMLMLFLQSSKENPFAFLDAGEE